MNDDVITIATASFTLLASGNAAMWVWVKKRFDKGEEDRTNLWRAMAKMLGAMTAVENCHVPECPMKEVARRATAEAEEALEPDEVRRAVMRALRIQQHAPKVPSFSVPPPMPVIQ